MASYYDFVLAFIPLSLLGVAGFLTGVGVDLALSVPLGAAVAAAFIGHAMFVRAPISTREAPAAPEAAFAPQAD